MRFKRRGWARKRFRIEETVRQPPQGGNAEKSWGQVTKGQNKNLGGDCLLSQSRRSAYGGISKPGWGGEGSEQQHQKVTTVPLSEYTRRRRMWYIEKKLTTPPPLEKKKIVTTNERSRKCCGVTA